MLEDSQGEYQDLIIKNVSTQNYVSISRKIGDSEKQHLLNLSTCLISKKIESNSTVETNKSYLHLIHNGNRHMPNHFILPKPKLNASCQTQTEESINVPAKRPTTSTKRGLNSSFSSKSY